MADNFNFTTGDTIVTDYLTEAERDQIVTQQASTEYTFEFHSGHLTGNPIYFRPDGNTDTSNMPKIDTRNKSAGDYNTIGKLANSGKLRRALSPKAQTEILTIIKNDWPRLQILAERFWSNTKAPAPVVAVAQQNTTPCSFAHCNGAVPLILDPHTSKRQKAACDTCYSYQ